MGLVAARGDRAVIELAAPGPQVRKGDVSPLGNRVQAVGVDAADPHAAVVRDEDIPRHRTIVPRQSVNLRPDGRFEPPFGTLAVPHHDRITAVGIVLDPSELLARSRGIERVSLPFRRAGHTVGEVHVTQLRVDALFEKRGTAVLGPPDAAVGHRRTGPAPYGRPSVPRPYGGRSRRNAKRGRGRFSAPRRPCRPAAEATGRSCGSFRAAR